MVTGDKKLLKNVDSYDPLHEILMMLTWGVTQESVFFYKQPGGSETTDWEPRFTIHRQGYNL